jgi:hypothetical protein
MGHVAVALCPQVSALWLCNRTADHGESRNLAAEHPDLVAKLDQVWQAWNIEQAGPLFGPAAVTQSSTAALLMEVAK